MWKVSPKVLKIESLVFTIILTLVFLMASITKLSGNEMMADNFVRWGYPVWFMYVVGTLELAGVIGLWIKRVRMWAALGFFGLMIAALGTHLMHDPLSVFILPGVMFLFAGKLVWIRKRQANLPELAKEKQTIVDGKKEEAADQVERKLDEGGGEE